VHLGPLLSRIIMVRPVDLPASAAELTPVRGTPADNGIMGLAHILEGPTVDGVGATPAGSAEVTTRPVSEQGWSSKTPTSTVGASSQ
jgi:hypothetical protein